jgi:hypothetical protein
MLKAGIAAAILPQALTYSRRWVRGKEIMIPIIYTNDPFPPGIPFNPADYQGEWSFIDVPVAYRNLPDGTVQIV